MFSILFQHCSVRERTILKALIHSIGEGFFYLFLIIFQPFGASSWYDPKKYIILFGIVSLANSFGDLKYYLDYRTPIKMHWFFAHGGKCWVPILRH